MANLLTGTVVSDKRDKTITVLVTTSKSHPVYHKKYTVSTKYVAHDEDNVAKNGDKVSIKSCRPLSKTKNFVLDKVLEKSQDLIVIKDDTEA